MMNFLLYIWQLPQNIFGIIILLVNYENWYGVEDDIYYVKHISDSGISLGNYIFFDSDIHVTNKDICHERGHQKQSLILGWLYLPTIGLLSLIGNIVDRLVHKNHRKGCWYYKQPWERWADILGDVDR